MNFGEGQQCVRDFFVCLNQNLGDWFDVYKMFDFTTTNSSKCISCGHLNETEQNQIYIEMDVPPPLSNLNEFVEHYFHESSMVDYRCEDGRDPGEPRGHEPQDQGCE